MLPQPVPDPLPGCPRREQDDDVRRMPPRLGDDLARLRLVCGVEARNRADDDHDLRAARRVRPRRGDEPGRPRVRSPRGRSASPTGRGGRDGRRVVRTRWAAVQWALGWARRLRWAMWRRRGLDGHPPVADSRARFQRRADDACRRVRRPTGPSAGRRSRDRVRARAPTNWLRLPVALSQAAARRARRDRARAPPTHRLTHRAVSDPGRGTDDPQRTGWHELLRAGHAAARVRPGGPADLGWYIIPPAAGEWPNGKAPDSGSGDWRFDFFLASQSAPRVVDPADPDHHIWWFGAQNAWRGLQAGAARCADVHLIRVRQVHLIRRSGDVVETLSPGVARGRPMRCMASDSLIGREDVRQAELPTTAGSVGVQPGEPRRYDSTAGSSSFSPRPRRPCRRSPPVRPGPRIGDGAPARAVASP